MYLILEFFLFLDSRVGYRKSEVWLSANENFNRKNILLSNGWFNLILSLGNTITNPLILLQTPTIEMFESKARKYE